MQCVLSVLLVVSGPVAAAPDRSHDASMTGTKGAVPAPIEPRLAKQPCTWPERYAACMDSCERRELLIEERRNCTIDTRVNGHSTCRQRLVDQIKACKWRCAAEFCPQFRP